MISVEGRDNEEEKVWPIIFLIIFQQMFLLQPDTHLPACLLEKSFILILQLYMNTKEGKRDECLYANFKPRESGQSATFSLFRILHQPHIGKS